MTFHIALEGYRVKVRDGLLLDEQGAEAAGLHDWPNHRVWLSGRMPVQRRLATLVHELWHAWKAEFGEPADEEAEANQVAAFTISFWRQLEVQGGEPALVRLTADGVVDKSADVDAPPSRWEPRCPDCNGYLELPIRDSAPRFDARLNRLAVDRAGDCEHCGHTVTWPESCTTKGVPTGNPLGAAVRALAHAAPLA